MPELARFSDKHQQDRQLAKNIFFLANNFGESRHFSHDELIQVVTCRQMGRPSRQLLL
jgi:hypothetical protein